MTNTFVAEGGEFATREARQTLLPRLVPFIGKCRAAGILVVFARQVLAADGSDAGSLDDIYPGRLAPFHAGGWGIEIYPELDPQPADKVLDKPRFSAFHGTALQGDLEALGIDTVIINSGSTAVGCESTARDAASRDFKVIFTSDGTITRALADSGWGAYTAEEVHHRTLAVLGHSLARIASLDEIAREIQQHAGSS